MKESSKGFIKKGVLISVGLVTVFLVIFSIYLYRAFNMPNYPDGPNIVVTIPKGSSFGHIADLLYQSDIIESRFRFYLVGRMLGWEEQIQSGMFEVPAGKTNYDLLKDLKFGRLRMVFDVTIFEGIDTRRMAGILRRRMGLDSIKIVTLVHDSLFAAQHGITTGSLKGYLLPDRYRFFGDYTEDDVLRIMINEFKIFYSDSLQRRTQQLGLTVNEVLTMASVVEGETTLDSEKPTVAGLYYNRIRRRMPLQADATVQYALSDEPPRRLLYRDYRVQSPYNTYLFRGLPPGPINYPGRRAILAALYPEEHNYLYMVTDGTGGHTFTETYSDHQRAVRRFRQFRAEQEQLRAREAEQLRQPANEDRN